MSPKTLRTLVTVFLFIHAIGHIQGIIAALGVVKSDTWNARSWLFDSLLGERGARMLALVLMIIVVLGFLATAFSFLGIGFPHEYWRTLAIIFAIPATLSLFFYWNAFAMFFNKIGAIGVNGWILIGLLLLKWPSEADLGF
ncbi:MAG: hypothetical protein JXA25_11645 [Anaerolineales bacterium]|nr:hypothetical protein [Anaerolineales bacterium]